MTITGKRRLHISYSFSEENKWTSWRFMRCRIMHCLLAARLLCIKRLFTFPDSQEILRTSAICLLKYQFLRSFSPSCFMWQARRTTGSGEAGFICKPNTIIEHWSNIHVPSIFQSGIEACEPNMYIYFMYISCRRIPETELRLRWSKTRNSLKSFS